MNERVPERFAGYRSPGPGPVEWGPGLAVATTLLAFVVGQFVFFALASETDDGTLEIGVWAVIATLVVRWAVFVGGVGIAARSLGSLTALVGRFDPRDALVGVPVGIAMQLLAVPGLYWLVEAAFGEQDVDGVARELFDRASGGPAQIALAAAVVLGAPLFEELLYRGVLQPALVTRWGERIGVVATALIFAAVHLQVLQFPGLLMFGLVLGVLTAWSGRLGPAFWAHVAFNGTTALVLLS